MMSDDDLPDTRSPTGIGNAADTPSPMDTSNAGDVPSPTNISKAGSCSSLYGTDIVIEDQRQSIEGVAEHVLYCKLMLR